MTALMLWCCAVVRLSELALAVAVLGEESALLLCVTPASRHATHRHSDLRERLTGCRGCLHRFGASTGKSTMSFVRFTNCFGRITNFVDGFANSFLPGSRS